MISGFLIFKFMLHPCTVLYHVLYMMNLLSNFYCIEVMFFRDTVDEGSRLSA